MPEKRPELAVNALVSALEIEGHQPCPPVDWLLESQADPITFWRDLVAYAPGKTSPFEHYDFYHDLVVRHLGNKRPAFRWFTVADGWETLTFEELDFICRRRAKEWQSRGIAEGQTVCILQPIGPDLVIALLTALRLGAVVSYLSPANGDRFLKKRLEALSADHIATDRAYESLIPDFKDKIIPYELTPEGEHEGLFAYPAKAPVAKLFSPLAAATDAPVPLGADEAYFFALRDGLVAYSLRPGDTLAAPGIDPLQHQPSLLLAALLNGSAFAQISVEDAVKDPKRLQEFPIKSLGVSLPLRDGLMAAAKGPLAKQPGSWWRPVAESADLLQWHAFVTALGLESVPGANLHVDAARGGCIFFSAKRRLKRGGANSFVLPAAGTPWVLCDLNATGALAEGKIGLYSPKPLPAPPPASPPPDAPPPEPEKPPPPGTHVLSQQGNEWYFVGRTDPHRRGRTYPQAEILSLVEELPFVLDCSMTSAPTADPSKPHAFVLLIFCGHDATADIRKRRDEWRGMIDKEIARRIDADLLPDKVELFPFFARRDKDGKVDHDWCRRAYATGSLFLRSTEEPFLRLNEIRDLALGWPLPYAAPPEPPPPPGETPPSDSPPPEETPPSDSPPPEETPPAETPPSETPPSETPPSETPPSETPPSDTPPSETPPSDTPPSETPPSETPPSETPSETPPSETPPGDAPPSGDATAASSEASTAPSESPPAEGEAPPAEAEAPPADADAAPTTESAPPSSEEAPPPSEDAPPPSEDAPPPSEDAPPPSEDAPPPSEDAPPPSGDAPPPSEDAPPPSEDAPPPSEDAPPPSEDAPPPSEDAPPPSGDAPPPSEDAPPPSEDAPPPSEDAPPPSEDAPPPSEEASRPPAEAPAEASAPSDEPAPEPVADDDPGGKTMILGAFEPPATTAEPEDEVGEKTDTLDPFEAEPGSDERSGGDAGPPGE